MICAVHIFPTDNSTKPNVIRFATTRKKKHRFTHSLRASTLWDTCKIDNYDENLWHFRSVDNTKYHTRHGGAADDDDLNA